MNLFRYGAWLAALTPGVLTAAHPGPAKPPQVTGSPYLAGGSRTASSTPTASKMNQPGMPGQSLPNDDATSQRLAPVPQLPAVLPPMLPAARPVLLQPPAEQAQGQPSAGPVSSQPPPLPFTAEQAAVADCDPRTGAIQDSHMGPDNLVWFRSEYLLAWLKKGPLPAPLVVNAAGATVIGQSDFDYGTANGIAFGGGIWFNQCHTFGIDLSGFVLEQRGAGETTDPTADLFRPVLATLAPNPADLTNTPINVLLNQQGVVNGTLAVRSTSSLAGAEANLIRNITATPSCRVDLLVGFRYFDLEEGLTIDEHQTAVRSGVFFFNGVTQPADSTADITDHFVARNQFYAGTIGVNGELACGPAFIGLTGKVSLGSNHETVDVTGSTTVGGVNQRSGLLAVSGGNVGRYSTDWFAVAPEVSARVGFQVTSGVRFWAGYNFFYLNNVVRPGDQVSLLVNPRLVPTSSLFGTASGPSVPAFPFTKTDFFVQSVQFGMELKY